jgi:hypothetical protein
MGLFAGSALGPGATIDGAGEITGPAAGAEAGWDWAWTAVAISQAPQASR